jgi:hypothetical protein
MIMEWEALAPCETGRFDAVLDGDMIADYWDRIGDEVGLAKLYDSDGSRFVPPDLIGLLAVRPLFQTFVQKAIGPNLRTAQEYQYRGIAKVGDRITAVGRITEKYEDRDRRFFVMEGRFERNGEFFMLDRRVQMLLKKTVPAETS